MNLEDLKNDWYNTIENQTINSESKKMIDSIRRDAKYSSIKLLLSDNEIVTIFAMCNIFNDEAKKRKEHLGQDRFYNIFTNYIFIYENEGIDSFFEKIQLSLNSMRKSGLNKKLQEVLIGLDDDISFISLFNLKEYDKDVYLIVESLLNTIHLITKKGILFKKLTYIDKINFSVLVFFINAMHDYTGLSIEEVVSKYTNIPIGAINQAGLEIDELGLRKLDNYYSYGGKRHTTDYHMYVEWRKSEIKERLNKPYKPRLLAYPWGKI